MRSMLAHIALLTAKRQTADWQLSALRNGVMGYNEEEWALYAPLSSIYKEEN